LSFLITKGLATALSAGGTDNYSCFSELEVTITLTDKGVNSLREIVGYVLHYLKMLKDGQPQAWVI
jgi:secreted Zn-dependent insulinase-like peptidase